MEYKRIEHRNTAAGFVDYLFARVDRSTLIPGRYFGNAAGEHVPARYLMGTYGQTASKWLLDYAYEKHYKNKMTRARFDELTAGWIAACVKCYDCQGLLDAFAGVDINARTNYVGYCGEKGESVYNRIVNDPAAAAGYCVFKGSSPENIHHVGYVVGVADDGDPLIIEGKDITRGIIMSRFSAGGWNFFGVCDGLLEYPDVPEEKTIFRVTKPMAKGEKYAKMQEALNANGYPAGAVDGKWGKNSAAAFAEMLELNSDKKHVIITVDGTTVAEFDT